jgi:hypothetical protein
MEKAAAQHITHGIPHVSLALFDLIAPDFVDLPAICRWM